MHFPQWMFVVLRTITIALPFSCGEEFMYTVIKKVIAAKDINHRGQGLWVSLKILHGDMKQVSVFDEIIHYDKCSWVSDSSINVKPEFY